MQQAANCGLGPSDSGGRLGDRQLGYVTEFNNVPLSLWQADDRRKLLAFARDLLNSDYAGHRLTFIQFAQAPHFNHLAAVYNSFDFSGPLDFVKKAADLSDRIDGKK